MFVKPKIVLSEARYQACSKLLNGPSVYWSYGFWDLFYLERIGSTNQPMGNDSFVVRPKNIGTKCFI